MSAYHDAMIPEGIKFAIFNAIYAPMFWFLFVPITQRETRFGIAFAFGVILRTASVTIILLSGLSRFEAVSAALQSISFIISAFSVIGLIVWFFNERRATPVKNGGTVGEI